MWKKLTAFASLFTSLGTLFCCALPALFVTRWDLVAPLRH